MAVTILVRKNDFFCSKIRYKYKSSVKHFFGHFSCFFSKFTLGNDQGK